MKTLFKTTDAIALLILRILLAVVIFPHGAQKVLGWFGGYGFAASMDMFTKTMHIPALFAFLAIAAEFAGSIALALGLLTRVAAFGIGTMITVAALKVHLANGLFMNWSGKQAGEGFEYHILVLAIALALMIQGGGAASLDRAIYKKSEGATSTDETKPAPAR